MPKQFYIDFTTLRGKDVTVEIHSNSFFGTATEITGDSAGIYFDYEGDGSIECPIITRSATFNMLIESGNETWMNNVAGASEGNYFLVVYFDTALEFVGYIVPDQSRIPDRGFPFHFSIYAVDGISRLKTLDYVDFTTGNAYSGRETIIQHLLNITEHIDLDGVVTMPSVWLRSNCTWFDKNMASGEDLIAEVSIDHERFIESDEEGNTTYWSVYDVLEAICTQFLVRFFFAGGRYWFMQLPGYDNDEQNIRDYDNTGTIITTNINVNLDEAIDYSDVNDGKKLSGGNWTALRGVSKAKVTYNHLTNNNRAFGLNFTGQGTTYTLPGTLAVDANDTTKIRVILPIRIKSESGGGPLPYHRFYFSMTLQIGTKYLKRSVAGTYYQPEPEEATWQATSNTFDFYGPPSAPQVAGQWIQVEVDHTTPYLTTDMDGANIQLKIEIDRIEDPDGNILVSGTNIYPTWSIKPIIRVENEGSESIFNNDQLLFTSSLSSAKANNVKELETYFGDGPNVLSYSRLKVGAADTADWQITPGGTKYNLNQLLARELVKMLIAPAKVYQGVHIKEDINIFNRITDLGDAYLPVRLRYSSYYDRWEGDFVKVAIAPDDPNDDGPTPVGPGLPTAGNPVTGNGAGFENKSNIIGIIGATLSPTGLSQTVNSTTFNAASPKTIPVTPINKVWVKQGDVIYITDPVTGVQNTFTVSADYEPNATTITVTGTMSQDFPAGAPLNIDPTTTFDKGWTYLVEDFTGTEINVPSTTGLLPNPNNLSEGEVRRLVKVIRSTGTYIYTGSTQKQYGFNIVPEHNRIVLHFKARDEFVLVEVK